MHVFIRPDNKPAALKHCCLQIWNAFDNNVLSEFLRESMWPGFVCKLYTECALFRFSVCVSECTCVCVSVHQVSSLGPSLWLSQCSCCNHSAHYHPLQTWFGQIVLFSLSQLLHPILPASHSKPSFHPLSFSSVSFLSIPLFPASLSASLPPFFPLSFSLFSYPSLPYFFLPLRGNGSWLMEFV